MRHKREFSETGKQPQIQKYDLIQPDDPSSDNRVTVVAHPLSTVRGVESGSRLVHRTETKNEESEAIARLLYHSHNHTHANVTVQCKQRTATTSRAGCAWCRCECVSGEYRSLP